MSKIEGEIQILEGAIKEQKTEDIAQKSEQIQLMAENFGLTEIKSLAEKAQASSKSFDMIKLELLSQELMESTDKARDAMQRYVLLKDHRTRTQNDFDKGVPFPQETPQPSATHATQQEQQPPQQVEPEPEQIEQEQAPSYQSEIVDFDILQLLKDSMNKTQIMGMVNNYWTQTDQILTDLENAAPKKNMKEILMKANDLREAAEKFGLTELGQLAEDLENAAGQKKAKVVSELISTIFDATARAKDELQKWITS